MRSFILALALESDEQCYSRSHQHVTDAVDQLSCVFDTFAQARRCPRSDVQAPCAIMWAMRKQNPQSSSHQPHAIECPASGLQHTTDYL